MSKYRKVWSIHCKSHDQKKRVKLLALQMGIPMTDLIEYWLSGTLPYQPMNKPKVQPEIPRETLKLICTAALKHDPDLVDEVMGLLS